MMILAIDTSTRTGSIALVNEGVVLREIANSSDDPYSVGLFRDLQVLLDESNLTLGEIELFAVAAGPGSFTGLRIGLTAVKAWAELFGKPIAAVSGLHAIAALACDQRTVAAGSIIAAVMDARRGQVFGGVYVAKSSAAPKDSAGTADHSSVSPGITLGAIGENVVMGADEFVGYVQSAATALPAGTPVLFASPTPDVIRAAVENSPLHAATLRQVPGVLAGIIGRLGYEQGCRGDTVDALHLDANYVRRTDAEAKWTEKPATKT